MSRRTEAPPDFECPYRHACPHLDRLSTTWTLQVYQEASRLRQQYYTMEKGYQQRIAELEKALLEKDALIAQLRLEHQKLFKANIKKPEPIKVTVKRRGPGAPKGHKPWRRREPDHIDQILPVPAPADCPHCQHQGLSPYPEPYEHVQEDIVLVPRTRVTCYVHEQSWCPTCRRAVYQTAEGEVRGCQIGPLTRALAAHLRYDLQIPYLKVRRILSLFGMSLVPATAMAFDRQFTALGRPLYEHLRVLLQSAEVVYGDETSWRENGQSRYIWFGGNNDMAVYQITDNRLQDSAVALLGESFQGTLVSDDYAGYNATHARHQQTCWAHLGRKAGEVLQQIELTAPPMHVPQSVKFCQKLKDFTSKVCDLGRQMRQPNKNKRLSLRRATAMIPSLQRELDRFASKPVEHAAAETLRQRVMVKDKDKLFTFLRVKGVQPTNNHAERSLRFLVIMRKICFGTRSAAGTESHAVLPSILQTARQRGKDAIEVLVTLLTKPMATARAALLGGGGSDADSS